MGKLGDKFGEVYWLTRALASNDPPDVKRYLDARYDKLKTIWEEHVS